MEKMLIFVADLTTVPPPLLPGSPTRTVSPTRTRRGGRTVLRRLFIAEYLIHLFSAWIPREKERKEEKRREKERKMYGCVAKRSERERHARASRGWFINNAKCLNIENSSAFPKSDDKASVTRCVAPDAPVLLRMNEIAPALL